MRSLLSVAVLALCSGVLDAATIHVPADQPTIQPDVGGSCSVDISDLVYLVNYMFTGGPDPLVGSGNG